jgi:hypothetical protein
MARDVMVLSLSLKAILKIAFHPYIRSMWILLPSKPLFIFQENVELAFLPLTIRKYPPNERLAS